MTTSGLYSFDELMRRIHSWRLLGKKIVFTNGCFDLIHPGHVKLIREASDLGDILIIGLNSDDSVTKLKGTGRPLFSAPSRSNILTAMKGVDAVILFDDDTPLKLILAIRPDVLVKGGDYKADNIVGASEVRSWGGSVHIVQSEEGFSTSAIEQHIIRLSGKN